MSIKTSSIYTSGNDQYFYSNKIKVFPCAYRNSTYDATARLNTEYNFTHLPHMVDKASYIIKFDNEKLICVINGYYFEIELGTNDSGISDYSILYNKNKYLNICVARPNVTSGTNFIEGPHLCSWDKLSSIEGTLDIEQIGGTFFAGLKIGDGVLSNGNGYQCYALKLDASAMLPIMANKIENTIKNKGGVENGTGKPINKEFTTETLSATTSISTPALSVANNKLTVNSNNITANVPVTINNTLEVKDSTATTSILKAESTKVTINKPTGITGTTEIKKSSSGATDGNLKVAGTGNFGGKLTVTSGGTDITGDTQIKKSSSVATDGNLTVAGRGSFGGELSVTADIDTGTAFTIGKVQQQNSKQQDLGKLLCADVEVPLFVKNNLYVRGRNIDIGNTSSVPNITIYGIQPKSNDTSTFANGELLKIDQVTGKIAVYGLKDNEAEQEADKVGEIFSIDPKTGETFANKINATVEGTSKNAINAENVTTYIGNISISSIFESNGLVAQKASSLTATSSGASAGKVVVVGNTSGTTDALLPKNDTGRTYDIGSRNKNFNNIYATTFHGELDGNASTANNFNTAKTIELTGAISGSTTGGNSNNGWSINTTISADTKIANSNLKNSSIKIGSKSVVELGSSIGTQDTPFKGDLYFGKQKSGNENDCSIIITGQYKKNDTEYPLKILDYNGNTLIQFTNNYGVFNTTSVPKQIIYAATDNDKTKGKTELFGDKICIYAQGQDGLGGTIKAGMVDLSAHESNSGLWIRNIKQIHVNNASLKSSTALQIVKSNNYDYVKISNGSSTINSLLVNGLSEFTSRATFEAGISVTGTAEATTFNAKSDRRLKENIIDYKPEKSILDLPIKKFDFIDGPKNQIGCIAQDLKEICPEIVNENEKGYLSIQENKLVYLLLDEVKKLKNEVEELKRK